MCKLLLSINPEFVEKIFAGVKKYEFRKSQCKRPIDGIVIYCTSPVMKVVGEVSVVGILVEEPSVMWTEVKELAGVTKEFYDSYFSGRKNAVAYQLGKIKRFYKPRELDDYGVKHAPQSFVYI